MAKEMHEKRLQQELERQKEEDEQKRKIRKPKQGPVKEELPTKKSQTANRQVEPSLAPYQEAEAEGLATVPSRSIKHISPPEN